MTADELGQVFNDTFGLNKWPESYVVDAHTYANVCQRMFDFNSDKLNGTTYFNNVCIILGKNNGIMFKGVELILKQTKL